MTKALMTILFLLLSFTTMKASAQSVEGAIQSVNLKQNTLKLNNKKYVFDRYLKVLLISASSDYLSVNQLVKGMLVKLDYETSNAKGRKIKAITLLIH
jgi:hypothetical protein